MSSDFIQHAQTERAFMPKAMRNATSALSAIDEALEQDGLARALGAATAIINKAYAIIERSEKRIRELEDLSTTDELTGLLNRRGFFEAFKRETGRAARKVNKGGLLILIDVDNFHAVNKIYGQEAGDTCLRMIGSVLQNEIRPMDVAARLGADEFVLLLSNTEEVRALERVQHLALRLNNLSFIWHGAEICTSASLGLKNFQGGERPEDIFRAADRHMHANKIDKKNRMN